MFRLFFSFINIHTSPLTRMYFKMNIAFFASSQAERMLAISSADIRHSTACPFFVDSNVPYWTASHRPLSVSFQIKRVCNDSRKLLPVMRHHNHSLVLSFTESLDDIFYQPAIPHIQPMERLIKNQQFRILHKGTRKQNHALLSALQL